jgi:hypothetical protein
VIAEVFADSGKGTAFFRIRYLMSDGWTADEGGVIDLTGITFTSVPPLEHRHRLGAWQRPVETQCANCDEWFPCAPKGSLVPYCSLGCKAEAKVVRYIRAKLIEYGVDSIRKLPADIRDAAIMKMAHAIGGGYDDNGRRLPPEPRRAVFHRDHDLCVRCGGPGAEIDHIDGPSAEISNLRLLCGPCHREITKSHFEVIEPGSAQSMKADELNLRAFATIPERPCDAPGWNSEWRRWAKANSR